MVLLVKNDQVDNKIKTRALFLKQYNRLLTVPKLIDSLTFLAHIPENLFSFIIT